MEEDRKERKEPTPSLAAPGFGLFIFLCAFRVANTYLIRSYFDPDEYWQTLEPAYCTVFQPEEKCAWTWEWTRRPPSDTTNLIDQSMLGPARTYVSVLPTILFYKVLQLFGISNNLWIARFPMIWNAVLVAAPTDWAVAYAGFHLWGTYWPLIGSLTSWFQGYSLVRAFANSQETALLMLAIALLSPELLAASPQKETFAKRSALAFFLGGLSVSIRFTSLAAFVPLGIILSLQQPSIVAKIQYIFASCALFGSLGLLVAMVVDRYFFGFWTIPFLGNFHFNVILNHASLYGAHPWHWYFTTGLPAISGILLPLIMFVRKPKKAKASAPTKPVAEPQTDSQKNSDDDGEIDDVQEIERLQAQLAQQKAFIDKQIGSLNSERTKLQQMEKRQSTGMRNLWIILLSYLIIMSFNAHKEFRYIHPVLPLLCVIAGPAIQRVMSWFGPERQRHGFALFGVPNLCVVMYLGLFHQLGAVKVNRSIVIASQRVEKQQRGSEDASTLFSIHYLTGACHSTPLYSALHSPTVQFDAYTLDCSPSCRADPTITCEYEDFDRDPVAFVNKWYGIDDKNSCVDETTEDETCGAPTRPLPDFIVTHSRYAAVMPLETWGYTKLVHGPHHLQGVRLLFGLFEVGSQATQLERYPYLYGLLELNADAMLAYRRQH